MQRTGPPAAYERVCALVEEEAYDRAVPLLGGVEHRLAEESCAQRIATTASGHLLYTNLK